MAVSNNTRNFEHQLIKGVSLNSNNPIKSTAFSKLLENQQAESNQFNGIKQIDLNKPLEQIEKAADYSTKLLLSHMKNQGITTGDNGGDNGKIVSEIANNIAGLMGSKALIQAQIMSIDAQKNPAVNLMDLKDKIIDYKDDTKNFNGEDPVKFNYKVTHNEDSPTAVINLVFTIRDSKNLPVATVRKVGKLGEHQFVWDGKNDKGEKVENGTYTLDIKATGHKDIGGNSVTFPVTANAILSGKVDSIKIDKGVAVGLFVNNSLIARDQIQGVRDIEKIKEANYLNPDLINKNVSLDFSRAQVKKGKLDVYYNNHVENVESVSINVYDLNNKFMKTINHFNKIEIGSGKISIKPKDANLEDGNYILKVFVNGTNDLEKFKTELKYDYKTKVVGIDLRLDEFLSNEEDTFSAYNINSIVGDYLTPIEQRRQDYIGAKVTYRNDIFKFENNEENVQFLLFRPEEDGVINYGQMSIYDETNKCLVKIIKGEYKPYYYLDDASRVRINNYINGVLHVANYDNLNEQQRIQANFHIEDEIRMGNIALEPEYQEYFEQGRVLITFPTWDGSIDDSDAVAKVGASYRREFTPIYAREDGSEFSGETDRPVLIANVESVDQEDGELILNMVGGSRIPEEMLIGL